MFAQLGYYICMPFAWLTRLFYSLTGSYGVALILFTLVVKLVMLPFQLKSKKSMLRMSRMSGKIKDIQTRYANNKERQQQEMADLYAREGINPMSGCLWTLIPFPIPAAIYGLVLMLVALLTGLLKPDHIKEASSFLISVMPVLFVPPAVRILEYWGIIAPNVAAIVTIAVVSTFLVFAVSALVVNALMKKKKEGKDHD